MDSWWIRVAYNGVSLLFVVYNLVYYGDEGRDSPLSAWQDPSIDEKKRG